MRKIGLLLAVALFFIVSLGVQAQALQGTVTTTYNVVAPVQPSADMAEEGAGLCDNGIHYVKVAYVTSTGISALSIASAQVTVTDNTLDGKIAATIAASTNPSVTAINFYMTKAGGTDYFLAGSRGNTSGTTKLSVADASLTAAAPTTDTSAVDTLINASGTSASYSVWLLNHDGSLPVYLSFNGDTVSTSAGPFLAAGQSLVNPCFVQLPGGGSIRLRSTTAGVSVSYVLWPK